MKIKTIIFGDVSSPSHLKLESVVSEAFSDITNSECESASVYSKVQDGMAEIASTLRKNNIIVLMADEKLYHEAKRNICKAFKFQMVHNETVLEKHKALKDSERYMLHALTPKNATVFHLSDGLFPGFAVRSKSQCIFFLPFSEDRTFLTMKKYVFPYISRVYGATLPAFSDYEVNYSAEVLRKQLEGTDTQISISNTPVAKYIAHAGKSIDSFDKHVSYAPYDSRKAAKEGAEYSAISASEYHQCRFGASITESSDNADGSYAATIVITNRKTATIRTISSISDESHEDFMNTVVNEFFIMLAHEILTAPELTEEDIKCLVPTPTINGIRILLYVLIFAATFFTTYVVAAFSNLAIFS
ncbi:MAG: hypothetical protein IKV76_07310 [Clostridia bacterium]|nr:hypothetical protein [Clostridia bacterium]